MVDALAHLETMELVWRHVNVPEEVVQPTDIAQMDLDCVAYVSFISRIFCPKFIENK